MREEKYITIRSNKKEIELNVNRILYIAMKRNAAEIHVLGGAVYGVRKTFMELSGQLGEGFILVHRRAIPMPRKSKYPKNQLR